MDCRKARFLRAINAKTPKAYAQRGLVCRLRAASIAVEIPEFDDGDGAY